MSDSLEDEILSFIQTGRTSRSIAFVDVESAQDSFEESITASKIAESILEKVAQISGDSWSSQKRDMTMLDKLQDIDTKLAEYFVMETEPQDKNLAARSSMSFDNLTVMKISVSNSGDLGKDIIAKVMNP